MEENHLLYTTRKNLKLLRILLVAYLIIFIGLQITIVIISGREIEKCEEMIIGKSIPNIILGGVSAIK